MKAVDKAVREEVMPRVEKEVAEMVNRMVRGEARKADEEVR